MDRGELWVGMASYYVFRCGFSVIPMGHDKKPMIKWAEFQARRPTLQEILSWPRANLAIITGQVSGICVIDCESRDAAEWFYLNRGRSPAVVQTRRGYHLYYRHPGVHVSNAQRVEEMYDVRGDGGYVLAPPSQHSEGEYKWILPLGEVASLPVFNPDWRPASTSRQTYDRIVRDGAAYVEKIFAISGQGGHNDTFRAACVLREAGMSEAEAFVAMQAWNETNAQPPWSPAELLHKVRSAYT